MSVWHFPKAEYSGFGCFGSSFRNCLAWREKFAKVSCSVKSHNINLGGRQAYREILAEIESRGLEGLEKFLENNLRYEEGRRKHLVKAHNRHYSLHDRAEIAKVIGYRVGKVAAYKQVLYGVQMYKSLDEYLCRNGISSNKFSW